MSEFTYRPPEGTEKIILEYMEKENYTVRTKCINFLIDSRPALDKELAAHKKQLRELSKQLQSLQSLLVEDRVQEELELIIQALMRSKNELKSYSKKFKPKKGG